MNPIKGKGILTKEMFRPRLIGFFFNPFFLIRRGLFRGFQKTAPMLSGKLLDFGCGTGEFLAQCTKSGFKTFGYEPNENASNQATSKGLSIIQNLKDLNQKMDAITAWHVVEHVPNLRDTIKDLKKKLSKDGILFIAVPNVNSFDARHYKEYWAAYDVPRHLYHFSQNSFGKLIAKCKLHLVDTIPMKFDSYYVSLLSEKYLNGKTDFIRALKTGYKSNHHAKKNGEYSSLIYVLKK